MKQFGLWLATATAVLSFTALSFAQAPPATPIAAMSGKGEMKDDMKGGMKQSDGMEKKADGMMDKRKK